MGRDYSKGDMYLGDALIIFENELARCRAV